jgi:hypothetical protein
MIEQFTVGNLRVEIDFDHDPLNPRKYYDNFGHMVCWHSRYDLGDEQPKQDPAEWIDAFVKSSRGAVMLPLYLYDHSGITMKTSPFSCPWDSGQVGWIYVSREEILRELGGSRLTEALRDWAREILRGEVEIYDKYLTGETYQFVVFDCNGEVLDSGGGFDDLSYCTQEAKAAVDYITQAKAA